MVEEQKEWMDEQEKEEIVAIEKRIEEGRRAYLQDKKKLEGPKILLRNMHDKHEREVFERHICEAYKELGYEQRIVHAGAGD